MGGEGHSLSGAGQMFKEHDAAVPQIRRIQTADDPRVNKRGYRGADHVFSTHSLGHIPVSLVTFYRLSTVADTTPVDGHGLMRNGNVTRRKQFQKSCWWHQRRRQPCPHRGQDFHHGSNVQPVT